MKTCEFTSVENYSSCGSTVKAAQHLSKEARHLLTSEQRSKIHAASSEILKIEDRNLRDLVYSG